ncbi:MAG TPA: YhcH/YjgK/YiaL family protein [Cytophagaceae bacterium]|nr:YhcH/YjgK/YiaL family protein [Cytophagaceae bacterium]
MILDHLDKSSVYFSVHPKFETAFQFLKTHNLKELQPGIHEIDGRKIFAIISDGDVSPLEVVKMEVHRKYIDIQYVISGIDKIGYRYLGECKSKATEFDVENDYELYRDEPEMYLHLTESKFVIFFPEDAHAPLLHKGKLRKIVIKVEI